MTVKSSPFPKVPTWWDWSQVELCFSIKIPIVPRTPAGTESNLNEEILAPVSSDDDIKLLYHCITNSPSDFITLHCLKTLSHYTRLYLIPLPLNNVVPTLRFSYTHFEPSHCVIMTSHKWTMNTFTKSGHGITENLKICWYICLASKANSVSVFLDILLVLWIGKYIQVYILISPNSHRGSGMSLTWTSDSILPQCYN